MASVSSSYRIPEDLHSKLERAAKRSGKGKNWVITEALRHYLDEATLQDLKAEARRQSLLAAQSASPDEEFWEQINAETLQDV